MISVMTGPSVIRSLRLGQDQIAGGFGLGLPTRYHPNRAVFLFHDGWPGKILPSVKSAAYIDRHVDMAVLMKDAAPFGCFQRTSVVRRRFGQRYRRYLANDTNAHSGDLDATVGISKAINFLVRAMQTIGQRLSIRRAAECIIYLDR